jgi:hypothetical protein
MRCVTAQLKGRDKIEKEKTRFPLTERRKLQSSPHGLWHSSVTERPIALPPPLMGVA